MIFGAVQLLQRLQQLIISFEYNMLSQLGMNYLLNNLWEYRRHCQTIWVEFLMVFHFASTDA